MATVEETKVDEECWSFQDKWTSKFLCGSCWSHCAKWAGRDVLSVRGKRPISSVITAWNMLNWMFCEDKCSWIAKLTFFGRVWVSNRAAFTRPHSVRDNAVQESFAVSELIAMKLKPRSEGDHVKGLVPWCRCGAASTRQKSNCSKVCLSQRTVAEVITNARHWKNTEGRHKKCSVFLTGSQWNDRHNKHHPNSHFLCVGWTGQFDTLQATQVSTKGKELFEEVV